MRKEIDSALRHLAHMPPAPTLVAKPAARLPEISP